MKHLLRFLSWATPAPASAAARAAASAPPTLAGLAAAPADPSADGEARPLTVATACLTDVGCVRADNEDDVRIVTPASDVEAARHGVLAVVCDGMGGHQAGEVASRLAVETLLRRYRDATATTDADPQRALPAAVQAANRAILEAAQRDPALRGMGTTCTAFVLRGALAYCAHVGDSRLYLARNGALFHMTEDHSAVMHLVHRGVLSTTDARWHADRNVLARALGSRRDVEVTSWPTPFAVRRGDRFLLCSDGLHDLVSESVLLDALEAHEPAEACRRLVACARAAGGPDNISVAIVAVGTGRAGSPAPAASGAGRAEDRP